MGAGNNSEKTGGEMPLQPPPAYQEKEPIDPVVIVEKQAPVIVQQPAQCKKRHGKCCCYCCCLLIVLMICCTIIPIVIVKLTQHYWNRPETNISFARHAASSTYRVGEEAIINCKISMHSGYVPLVQWFHDANDPKDGEEVGFKIFGVHDIIKDEEFKDKFEITPLKSDHGDMIFQLKIKGLERAHSGRYACQVAKSDHGDVKEKFQMYSSSSSSSSDDDDHHKHHHHRRCHRNAYVYLDVQK